MGKAIGKLSTPDYLRVVIFGQDGMTKAHLVHKDLDLGNITDTIKDDFGIPGLLGDQADTWNTIGSRCAIPISSYRHIDVFIYVVNDMELPWLSSFEWVKGRSDFSKSVLAVAVNKGTPLLLEEVRTGLDLDNISRRPIYEIFPIVATTDEGFDKIQDWLSQELGKKLTGLGSADQQQIKKRETRSLNKRIVNSFKGMFTRI